MGGRTWGGCISVGRTFFKKGGGESVTLDGDSEVHEVDFGGKGAEVPCECKCWIVDGVLVEHPGMVVGGCVGYCP